MTCKMEILNNKKKVISIISITSDIGTALAERYSKRGDIVVGTYRSESKLEKLREIENCHLLYCDLGDKNSIEEFIEEFKKLDLEWNTFISCPANPLPLKSFFGGNFDDWNDSFHINAIEQLRILHGLYSLRNKNETSNVVYFAGGGGANRAVVDFSAYNLAKITLTKMCEFLDAENPDMNAFIIGPGWTKTKNHELILKNTNPSSEKYQTTKKFLETQCGTSMDDIFNCIDWFCNQGREVAGGRNFSVVYDKWGNEKLAELLKRDVQMYKLRRYGNEIEIK
jgi:NAD(P)-dependent dehydrogenase (short-subunit alcohol dehydrogenase family)